MQFNLQYHGFRLYAMYIYIRVDEEGNFTFVYVYAKLVRK